MFTKTRAMFLYCTSPVHMGAGTAVGGLIDSPIQRERHTGHPVFAGSGLKGAVRHAFAAHAQDEELLKAIFGPDTSASDFAGAVSFSDAQLVAFPVRSPKRAYVYATSPIALARASRLLEQTGLRPNWDIGDSVSAGKCSVASTSVLSSNGQLILEALSIPEPEVNESLQSIAKWLGRNALSESYSFFRNKIQNDLVLLSDEEFGYFVKNSTIVEPHVRINDTSGTADDGGLFYTENLPPESLMLALLMASDDRRPEVHRRGNPALSAADMIDAVAHGSDRFCGLDGDVIQIGGDATTGRGLVSVKIVGEDPR